MKYHQRNPLYFQDRPVSRYDLSGPDVAFITEGEVDPVERLEAAPGKTAPHRAFTQLTEDSYNGYATERPRKGRVHRTNQAPGSDAEAGRHWQHWVTEEAGIDDAATPLDQLLRR